MVVGGAGDPMRLGRAALCPRLVYDGAMSARAFRQVDVFTDRPYKGNPLAVVLDADGLDTAAMESFTRWTNLSESVFVLPPTHPDADYRVRIFSPSTGSTTSILGALELPFAGHPTLGTCHAWLEAGGRPKRRDVILQECGAGLVAVRRTEHGLAFAAPPLVRSGPVAPELVEHIASVLGIGSERIRASQWVDNGPGWVAILLGSVQEVLELRPGFVDLDLGVVGPYPEGASPAFEVRAFFPQNGATVEDPVTGSLNASLAQWLIGTGRASAPYVARQGTALGRSGRVHVEVDDKGGIWVGGGSVTCIAGTIDL